MSGGLPDIRVYIRPESAFTVGGNMVLGQAPGLGLSQLGSAAASFYEITSYVQQVSVRRGRTRITDSFDSGSCTVALVDKTGLFNPDNASSPIYGYIKPLRQIRITAFVLGVEYILFAGYVSSLNYNYQVGYDLAYVSIEGYDLMRLLSMVNVTTVATEAYQDDSGTRIGKILDEIGLPNSLRNIEAGVTLLDNDPATTRSAIAAIQQCEESELGAFFISADGLATYYNRHTIQQKAAAYGVTPLLFDESSGINFNGITQSFDDQLVYNEVTIGDSGGATTTAVDAASIAEYFTRTLVKSPTLIITTEEVIQHANYVLNARKQPQVIIGQIAVDGRQLSDSQLTTILSTEMLHPVTVSKDYGSSGLFTRTLTLQGVSHTITPAKWAISLATAEPVSNGVGFVLGSTTFGVLGTDYLGF